MRKKILFGSMLAGALMAAPAAAPAQMALPVELGISGGAAFPTGDFGESDAYSTGWGFEVNAAMQLVNSIGVYVAFDRYDFPIEDAVLFGLGQIEGNLVDQGFAGGLQLSLPGSGFGLSPWVRGGAIYNSANFDFDNVDDDPETDSELGYEVGAGLDFPLGFVVSVTPSVRYRSYTPELNGSDFDISYLVGELGLTFRF